MRAECRINGAGLAGFLSWPVWRSALVRSRSFKCVGTDARIVVPYGSGSWEAKSAGLIGPGKRGVDAIEQIPGGELDGLSAIKAGINYRRRQAGER